MSSNELSEFKRFSVVLAFKEPCDEMDGCTSRQRSDRVCTRTNSVLSKHSSSGETPGGSSGGGTPTHHLTKQDSVGGGRSSGVNSVLIDLTVIALYFSRMRFIHLSEYECMNRYNIESYTHIFAL